MYRYETEEEVKARILNDNRIKATGLNTNEGAQINNIFGAYAAERSKLSISLEDIFNKVFIITANGELLDKRVNEFAVYRKEGTYSTGKVKFEISKETVRLDTGFVLNVNGLEYHILEPKDITSSDNTTVVVASSVGSEYNLYLQTDFEITKNLEDVGITKATVVEGFDNGVGVETDDELRERFFLTQRNNATSGNAEHYRQWALEVDGVYGAKVTPLWAGPGTVKVSISGRGNVPVSSEILEKAKVYIESVRPIGATVTVETTKLKDITIAARIEKVSNDIDISIIKRELEDSIREYLQTATTEVTYSKIYSIIAANESVSDVSNITLNSATANVAIKDNEVANLKTFTLEEM